MTLGAGESLLLLTDGLFETRSEADAEFGIERVLATLASAAPRGPQHCVERLRDAIEEHRKTEPNHDDITFLCAALD